MEYQVDLREVLAVATSLSNSGPVIDREIKTALTKSGLVVEGRAKELAPVDTGKLRQSITTQVRTDSALVGSNLQYAPTMEFGRRPGATMPPAGALIGWMTRHGMDTRMEFALRRAIARRGIPEKRFLRGALEQNRARIEGYFQEAAQNIIKQVVRK
jgi:phage gpG-like protein